MKSLISFLNKLEAANIYYTLAHHREDYVMVKVDIPGERWEVEFDEYGNVEIEIFRNSDGVHTDKQLLEDIFFIDNGIGFELRIRLKKDIDSEQCINRLLKDFVEPMGLALGGNPFTEDGAFLTMMARGDVSKETRLQFLRAISTWGEIDKYFVGELSS